MRNFSFLRLYGIFLWTTVAVTAVRSQSGRSWQFELADQQRRENWTAAGTATGFFGWTDVKGDGIDIEFIADENGYRVIKKRNRISHHRNPRDREDAEEFEFGDEDAGAADAYSFRYDTGTSFREEAKRGGVVFGKYGYIAADGRLHVVRYSASAKRGYVPIREIRDAAEYTTAAAEPITPVPLRRLRTLAAPPDLWPEDNIAKPSLGLKATVGPTPNLAIISNTGQTTVSAVTLGINLITAIPSAQNKINATSRFEQNPRRSFVGPQTLSTKWSSTPLKVNSPEPVNPPETLNPQTVIPTNINHNSFQQNPHPQIVNPPNLPSHQPNVPAAGVPSTSTWTSTANSSPQGIVNTNNRGSRAQELLGGRRQFSYNLGKQFHRQDEINNDTVSGQYGWKDATGVLRVIHYVADNSGFKIFKENSHGPADQVRKP